MDACDVTAGVSVLKAGGSYQSERKGTKINANTYD